MGKLTIALVFCLMAVYSSAATPKISLGVQQQLRLPGAAPKVGNGYTYTSNIVVRNEFRSLTFASIVDKRVALFSSLKAFAASSQKNAIALLNSNARTAGAYTAFWITNRIFVDGADAATIGQLAEIPEVVEIREQKVAHISPAVKSRSSIFAEWGIENTNADTVHYAGITGLGIVVSSIDTGVLYTHQALRNNYRNDGFSWYDPYSQSANPIDTNGHGTHTMGTIAGSYNIGMAPSAKWIACRGCESETCTENALYACGEFIACPHGPDGGVCDPNKTPHVVNNSWEAGKGDSWFDDIIDSWIAAGVVPVFSNGDSGAACGTVSSPADNTDVIGVGSTDFFNDLSFFSSCGPAQNGGHIKPDIAAPGSEVRSAYNSGDNDYETMSSTSMAARVKIPNSMHFTHSLYPTPAANRQFILFRPHVAGGVALYLQANPNATLQEVKNALYESANKLRLGIGAGECGGIQESEFPNHSYGHGILDVAAAILKINPK